MKCINLFQNISSIFKTYEIMKKEDNLYYSTKKHEK